MSTHGFLSIEKRSIRWSRADVDAYLTCASIGVLAGFAVTFLRTPIHMPGHKVIFWLAPALAGRLVTRAKAGATTGVTLTSAATALLGGELGGGLVMMPLLAFAGILLDITVNVIEQRNLAIRAALPLLALAGIAGNLICLIKRLFNPIGRLFGSINMHDLFSAAFSYALFGLLAGLCGAICGWIILKFQKPDLISRPPPS